MPNSISFICMPAKMLSNLNSDLIQRIFFFSNFNFRFVNYLQKKCQIQRQSFLLGTIVSAFLCQILTPYKLLYQILISKTVGPLCSPQFSAYVGLGMMVILVTSPWQCDQHTNKRHCLLSVIGNLKYHIKLRINTSCLPGIIWSLHQTYISSRILIQGS